MSLPWSTEHDRSHDQQQQQQQQHQQQQASLYPAHASSLRPLQPHPYLQPMPLAPYPPTQQQQQPPYAQYRPPTSNTTTVSSHDDRQQDVKRMRISRACDGCRRKKIKCDTAGPGHPCKNCQAAKIECTFNDSAKKRGPPKGYIEVLENRLKRMERILGGLADEDESTTADESSSATQRRSNSRVGNEIDDHSTLSSNSGSNNSYNPGNGTCSNTNNNTTTTPVPEKGKKTAVAEQERISGLSSLSSSGNARYIGDMSPLPFLAQKINFEDARVASHIGFKVRKFGQSLVMYKEDEDGQNGNIRLLQQLGKLKPGQTINTMNDWIYTVAGIDKSTSDKLMKVYFAYIHPGLPVVNKILFLKQYRRQLGDYPSPPLLNSIYGAAARYIETCRIFDDKVLSDIADSTMKEGWSESLFDNLLTYLKGRYTTPCVATIQALVISQYHRASLDEKMASGWLLNSAATRMAQDLGLHRSSDNWDIPESEKETRRRVWWSVYILDKWSAAATGRPQTIFDEDCDEIYPNDSALMEEVMDTPSSDQDDYDMRFPSLDRSIAQKVKGDRIPIYQPFVQLVKLSEILGRILQGLYTPRAKRHSAEHGSDAIVTYLDNTLSEWRASLPPSLQISTTNVRRLDSHGQSPLLSMSGIMYLTYCTLLILLHRPFIEKEEEGTRLSMSSLTICTNAATRCVDIAEKMHYRDFLLVSWNFAIYPIFTASLIHIYNAGSTDTIVADVAKANIIRSMSVIKRLSKLSPGACRLYEVLKKLMETRNISVDEDDISENEMQQQQQQKNKRKKRSGKATSRQQPNTTTHSSPSQPNPLPTPQQQPSATLQSVTEYPTTMPSGGKGVDGSSPLRLATATPSASRSSDADRPSSGGSTPTSFINGEWINGLYSSMEPTSTTGGEISGSDNDVHSLRQFGLPMESMFPTVEQVQLEQQQQQQPLQMAGSMMLPLNSADSFLFGIPDFGFTMGQLQQQQQQQSVVPSYSYAPETSSTNNTTTTACENHFRNRPDNPFWSVPSSLELDDWTAYLLPQQQQQQQQQASSSQPENQQWRPSEGWM